MISLGLIRVIKMQFWTMWQSAEKGRTTKAPPPIRSVGVPTTQLMKMVTGPMIYLQNWLAASSSSTDPSCTAATAYLYYP